MLEKVYRGLFNLLESVVTFLMVGMTICVIIQVLARFVIRFPLPWTEELARYMLIIIAFLGGALVSRAGEQLGAYFLRDRLKGKPLACVYVLNNIISMFFMVMIIRGGIGMCVKQMGQAATTMPWFSNVWLYVTQVIGYAIMILCAVRDIVWSVEALKASGRLPLKAAARPLRRGFKWR